MPTHGTVTKNDWTRHEARINGAKNDVATLARSHRAAKNRYEDFLARYEEAKAKMLSTGERLDEAKARLRELEAMDDPAR